MNQKDDRFREIIRELAATFFLRESNRTSLITVTDVEVKDRGAQATILITVMPEDKEEAALDFARRQLADLRDYVKANSRLMRIPFFDLRIDVGEKNRQRIDEIDRKL